MSATFENATAPLAWGQQITIAPKVFSEAGAGYPTPLYQSIVSGEFADESRVEPLTVLISKAKLITEIQGIGEGVDCLVNNGLAATYPIDRGHRRITAIVEWSRGGARYSLECDTGCCFVVPATSLSITARVEVNDLPRVMSASITRGAIGGGLLAPPRLTASWIQTGLRAAGVPSPLAGMNRIRVPNFARSFRAATRGKPQAICVVPYSSWTPTLYFQNSGRIFVTSWEDIHPIPPETNHLYVQTPDDANSGTVYVQFQLGL
jgi:hypothetical protein